jgi:hypothetical protein
MPFAPQMSVLHPTPSILKSLKVAIIRLLYQKLDGTFALAEDPDANHKYGVLSHTWSTNAKDEVTYEDILNNTGQDKLGYKKLVYCATWARKWDLTYFWCDTCCIDRPNHTELNEAITCMFQWYTDADICCRCRHMLGASTRCARKE